MSILNKVRFGLPINSADGGFSIDVLRDTDGTESDDEYVVSTIKEKWDFKQALLDNVEGNLWRLYPMNVVGNHILIKGPFKRPGDKARQLKALEECKQVMEKEYGRP